MIHDIEILHLHSQHWVTIYLGLALPVRHMVSMDYNLYLYYYVYLHLFPIKLLRRLDFPVPALPITKNLKRYSGTRNAAHYLLQ